MNGKKRQESHGHVKALIGLQHQLQTRRAVPWRTVDNVRKPSLGCICYNSTL